MSIQKHWWLGRIYHRGQIVHQQRFVFKSKMCNLPCTVEYKLKYSMTNTFEILAKNKLNKSIDNLVRKHFRSFPHSRLITGLVTRLTRRVPLVEQELLTILEHLSSPPVFSGVRLTRSSVLYVCFVDRCLSFCTFSFGHCVVCSSSIYGFWLPLWYLQTLLTRFCNYLYLVCFKSYDWKLKS